MYVRQQMVPLRLQRADDVQPPPRLLLLLPRRPRPVRRPRSAGLKEHPTAADFAAFKDVAPELRGTYAVKDGKITIQPDKGEATTEPFSVPKPGDDSVLQIGPPSVVGSVKADALQGRPEARRRRTSSTARSGSARANTIFNVKTLTFRPDGTLGSDQLSGVDTTGINTAVGNSGVTTGGQSSSAGTYHFNGYTLETTIGGKAEKATAFRWAGDDNPSAPGMICIAGRVYSRVGGKK